MKLRDGCYVRLFKIPFGYVLVAIPTGISMILILKIFQGGKKR